VDLPRANYIRTKPLHQSQQEISQETNQTHVVFTYQLRFNNELFAKLLEFGKDLEIIEPRHLREKMTVHIQEMAKKYGI
jgi:predicted DNA-binding transcriptional regulator YafY